MSHRKAVVRFAVAVDEKMLPPGSPVARSGAAIGAVAAIAPPVNGTRHDVTVCLHRDAVAGLSRLTVCYVDTTAPLPVLVCDSVEGSGALADTGQDLLFAGFPTLEEYLAWRAGRALQQGLGHLLQGLEQILQGVPGLAPPGPAPGVPKPPAN